MLLQKNFLLCAYFFSDSVITTPAFSGKSILIVKETRDTSNDLMLEIGLTSYNRDGIILFGSQYPNGTGDFVSVALLDGILEFRFVHF